MPHLNTDEDVKNIYAHICKAAKKECSKRGMEGEWEDVAQTVFEKVLRADRRGGYDDVPVESGIFNRRIWNETKHAVNNELRDYMYFSGTYLYAKPHVQALLQDVAWAKEPGSLDEAECRADIQRAYQRMSENYRVALWKKYMLGVQPKHRSAEAKTLERATACLMNYLNVTAPPQRVDAHEAD